MPISYTTKDVTPPSLRSPAYRILALGIPAGTSVSYPFIEHLTSCAASNPAAAQKIRNAVSKLAQFGITGFKPPKKAFRTVGPDKKLTELKPDDQRILAFRQGRTWIIVDAFAKPPQPKKQNRIIRSANDHRQAYLAQTAR